MALAGVDANIDQNKKTLLDAIARAGSAGAAEYKDAQTEITGYRQTVIDNAGKGFGGADVAASLQAQSGAPFDRRLADNASAGADFQSGLARSQASHENYLNNVSAAQGTLQAINANKLSDREFALKQIQAQMEAEAKRDEEDRQFKMQLELLKAQQSSESHAASMARSSAASAKANAPKAPAKTKFEEIMGMAEAVTDRAGPNSADESVQISNDMVLAATDRSVFSGRSVDEELAKIVGERYGMTPAEVNSVVTPAKLASYTKAAAGPAPTQDAVAKSLATKYDTMGVTYDLAKSVLGNVDYNADVQWILAGADGKKRAEVEQMMRQWYLVDRNWPSEYNILMGEYVNKLPVK